MTKLKKPRVKPTILEIGDVKIIREDKHNLGIYRFENVYNPVRKEYNESYQFKGFHTTILGSLKSIHRTGLLVDEKLVSDLNEHLNQVESSNRQLMNVLKEVHDDNRNKTKPQAVCSQTRKQTISKSCGRKNRHE